MEFANETQCYFPPAEAPDTGSRFVFVAQNIPCHSIQNPGLLLNRDLSLSCRDSEFISVDGSFLYPRSPRSIWKGMYHQGWNQRKIGISLFGRGFLGKLEDEDWINHFLAPPASGTFALPTPPLPSLPCRLRQAVASLAACRLRAWTALPVN